MAEHHPIQDAKDEVKHLEHEAEVGESARTPAIVVGGVGMILSIIIAVLLIVVFAAYYLAK